MMRRETHPFSGVNIESEDVSLEAGPVERPFYMYLRVSLPISVSLLALVLTLTTVAICLRKSKLSHLIVSILMYLTLSSCNIFKILCIQGKCILRENDSVLYCFVLYFELYHVPFIKSISLEICQSIVPFHTQSRGNYRLNGKIIMFISSLSSLYGSSRLYVVCVSCFHNDRESVIVVFSLSSLFTDSE